MLFFRVVFFATRFLDLLGLLVMHITTYVIYILLCINVIFSEAILLSKIQYVIFF
jgi:hypothetical protein